MEIAFVTVLLLSATALFAWEVWTIDIITLVMLCALIASGILTAEEAFAGFSSDIIIALGSLFVVTGALQDTGAAQVVTSRLFRHVPRSEGGLIGTVMAAVAALSSVMNNTTVTGLMVAPTAELAKRATISPSRVLMPLAFASMIGGTCTLIGTSTNIAISGVMPKHGLEPLGFFEITPLGIVVVIVGIVWMVLIGRRFLPHRTAPAADAEASTGSYLSELLILPESPLAGKRLAECGFTRFGIRVIRVVRGEDSLSARAGRKLREGDVLLFMGDANALMEIKATQGIEIHPDVKWSDGKASLDDQEIAEGVVLPDSRLVGATVRDASLYDASGAIVLGLHRRGHAIHKPIGDIIVRVGDVLLLQGDSDSLAQVREQYSLAFTSANVNTSRLRRGRVWITALSFLAAILVATTGMAPLSVCFLGAALLTVVCRCVHPEQALEHVPWRLLILIGGMTAFGTAVQRSGADQFYAGLIEASLAPYGALPVLGGFMLLTMVLSQPMSNAAAALVVLPVAIATAERLGWNTRPFAIGIMVASSLALATPFEPSCVIVFGPGRYRFRDYFAVGIPISLVLLAVTLVLLPWLWPLQ